MLLLYLSQDPNDYDDIAIFTFHYASTLSNLKSKAELTKQIYIPLCFYFIGDRTEIYTDDVCHLHSIMLLLYQRVWAKKAYPADLHSIMLLLYREVPPINRDDLDIYIPLCFYFIHCRRKRKDRIQMTFTFHYASTLSLPKTARRIRMWVFTFHYASTLSKKVRFIWIRHCSFTFHYASTLSVRGSENDPTETNLHSIMLLLYRFHPSASRSFIHYLHSIMLLLYRQVFNTVFPIGKLFTFHYASTLSGRRQAVVEGNYNLHSIMLLLYRLL